MYVFCRLVTGKAFSLFGSRLSDDRKVNAKAKHVNHRVGKGVRNAAILSPIPYSLFILAFTNFSTLTFPLS